MSKIKTVNIKRAILFPKANLSPPLLSNSGKLDKPQRREAPIEPDYTGFVIEDEFVIGYGLDYAEEYRNLPYVGVLKRSVYEK